MGASRAAGTCELCLTPGPFEDRDGNRFLEVHHLTRLADDGPDVVENCAALCPNCHRRLHYALDVTDVVAQLRIRIAEVEASLGATLSARTEGARLGGG